MRPDEGVSEGEMNNGLVLVVGRLSVSSCPFTSSEIVFQGTYHHTTIRSEGEIEMAKLKFCVYCGGKLKSTKHEDDEEGLTLKCKECGKEFEWNY
jgi:DNA-directed RNA polymerase subunit RPC12/RpoP